MKYRETWAIWQYSGLLPIPGIRNHQTAQVVSKMSCRRLRRGPGPETNQKKGETFIPAANIPLAPLLFGTSPSIGPALNANHRFWSKSIRNKREPRCSVTTRNAGMKKKGKKKKRSRANSRFHTLLMLKDFDRFALALNNVFRNHDFLHIRLRRNIVHYIEHDRF